MQENLKEKYFITDEELSRAVDQIKFGNIACDGAVLCAICDLLANGDIKGNAVQRKIAFKSREHEDFYKEQLTKVKTNDRYHRALIYTLGIAEDTRNHINEIFDIKKDIVLLDSVTSGWVTGTTVRLLRLAINLYTDDTGEEESEHYTVSQIFGYESITEYMLQAIALRFE